MKLKYKKITGFVQKTSLLKPPPPGLAPYLQNWDILPEKQLSEIAKQLHVCPEYLTISAV